MAQHDSGPHSAGWLDWLHDSGWRHSPWRRSARGNLYRRYRRYVLVVFRRDGDGACRWVVDDQRGGQVFSPGCFATEQEAIHDLMVAIAECEK